MQITRSRMQTFDYRPVVDSNFIGRRDELERLAMFHISGRPSHQMAFVIGAAGVGKTAFLNQFIARTRLPTAPLWIDMHQSADPNATIREAVATLSERRHGGRILVVLDGADRLTSKQVDDAAGSILNYKVVRSLVMASRRPPVAARWMPQPEIFPLASFEQGDTGALLRRLCSLDINEAVTARVHELTNGLPAAIVVAATQLNAHGMGSLRDGLSATLYDAASHLALTRPQLAAATAPIIITASESLIHELKKRPDSLLSLPSRKFEEVIAELLGDMGWEVQLTKATRDGGKDILAYRETEIGPLLCLVEAKRHRPDRPVGVELVRTLLGTLFDHQATSAMLVTTSRFSPDAKALQARHKYRLSLKEYADVVDWVGRYRGRDKAV